MTHIHHQDATAVPLYHWRGARPWLLDLTPDDTGWLLCICLYRQGDIALLPITWEQNVPPPHTQPPSLHSPSPTAYHTDALDTEITLFTLRQLQNDGWQVNGRLTLRFTGSETDPDFWQTLTAHLQSPTPNRKS